MPPTRPRLRKREIAFALAAGALAAGGAGAILSAVDDGASTPRQYAAQADRQTYQIGQFEEISTVGPQDVVVTIGDTYAVRSQGSPRSLELLEAVVEGDTLAIRPKEGFNWGNWRSLAGATFYVTVPRLEGVAVAGSGDVRIDRIEAESFEGTIAGSGELAIAQMRVEEADFKIGGGGNVVAAGIAREAQVSIGGSGDVRAPGLRSETASVQIAGSGNVSLAVNEAAKVSIMGSGDVDISGPARCTVTRYGSGQVRCEGGGGD